MSDSEPVEPAITFVPTPIGNLRDITLRAIDTLREADLIACEDTRHSRKLLNHLEIDKPLISLHDHNEDRRTPELISRAENGAKIAVISDAGTPCVSDPGHRFMRALVEKDLPYSVLPGPCAAVTALVASGFPPHPFTFGGFLPLRKGKRKRELEAALARGHTSVYYESPHRLVSTLEILRDLDSSVRLKVIKELTKKFENIYGKTILKLLQEFSDRPPRGEFTLVIDAKPFAQ